VSTVQLRNVRKSFGAVDVIQGVSVDIADGEFVVLVGPSGCGKSTLLRMIAGLETITSGEIAIDDRIVNAVEPKDRDIAMVFQNYALYPQMTVAQNLGFALELAHMPKAEIKSQVAAAAASLGLESLLGRYPRQLSGGQRQRVAMGRAIVRKPKVFLFDEPLSNLDAKLRVQVRAEIKELQRRFRTTTVYVTHDQVEAMTMGDKIVVLNGGRVEQSGAPLQLYDRPANLFVASFLGSPAMNLVSGRIDGADAARLTLPDGSSTAIAPAPGDWAGRQIVFGIRPEHIHVDPIGGLPCTVSLVEPTGSETHLIAHAGETQIVAVLRERLAVREGDTINLSLAAEQAHFFDPKTGQRLIAGRNSSP
jgi:multiple sugar transport system ATP-binding protein